MQAGRGISRRNALIQCLTQAEFVATQSQEDVEDKLDEVVCDPVVQKELDNQDQDEAKPSSQDEIEMLPIVHESTTDYRSPFPTNSTNEKLGNRRNSTEQLVKQETNTEKPTIEQSSSNYGALGLSGLSRMYQSRSKFTGDLDEDLQVMLNVYRTLAATCKLSKNEMALGIPMMLDGAATTLFSQKLAGESNFDRIVSGLEDEFTSEEKRNRLLRIWQKTSLREAMRSNPDKSEVQVWSSRMFVGFFLALRGNYMRVTTTTDSSVTKL